MGPTRLTRCMTCAGVDCDGRFVWVFEISGSVPRRTWPDTPEPKAGANPMYFPLEVDDQGRIESGRD